MDRAVVDASVALRWVVDEPGSEAAAALSASHLLAPALLLAECGNALWRKVREGALDRAEAQRRFAALRRAPVMLVGDDELAEPAMAPALRLDHPLYDCLYLALAEREGVPLVTDDNRLIAVAQATSDLAGLVRPLRLVSGQQSGLNRARPSCWDSAVHK